MADRPLVAFQGRSEGHSAFALVNAQWRLALRGAGFDVADLGATSAPPAVVIHHDFESRFTDFVPPPGAICVAVRTWDFGPLPPAWVDKINRDFVEYWAHSGWIAELAARSGVDAARIRVVPHGIDPERFRPDGPTFPLKTRRRFRFLFVGGVSLRKGSDILLEAYRRAFSASDDVCLVLKDHSGDLFYRENHARSAIERLRSDPASPEIEHVDRFFSDAELAALYRSCDAAVFPYRAEGFCIPILEAMASGVPAIVPEFGACLDYCDAGTSWLVKPRRIRAPVSRTFSVALGFEEQVAEVDFCELPIDRLAAALRATREEAAPLRAARSAAGVARAHAIWRWADATQIVCARVAALCDQVPASIAE